MSGKTIALIVAHPDDETLWAGGTILSHPEWSWFVISLCRASDPDRAPKFYRALKILGAEGNMGDMDDGPEQLPLDEEMVSRTILDLLPQRPYDLVITHNPSGEYTRHLRHEETARAVIRLWHDHRIHTQKLWTFAYSDGGGKYPPRPDKSADMYYRLPDDLWKKKFGIITITYGFKSDSFEATATTREEAFRQFNNTTDAINWLNNKSKYK